MSNVKKILEKLKQDEAKLKEVREEIKDVEQIEEQEMERIEEIENEVEAVEKEVEKVKEEVTLLSKEEGHKKVEQVDLKKMKKEMVKKEAVKREINFKSPTNLITKWCIENPQSTTKELKERLIKELGETMKSFSDGTIGSQITGVRTFLKVYDMVKGTKHL